MSIFAACQPRIEVRQGELNDAIFAADFGDLVAGRAPGVYADAAKFFGNTHPAQNLKDVAKVVFGRLANTKETGLTLRLSTGFGGGKTHTLMTLWHLGKNSGSPSVGSDVLASSGRPANVTTIAVDCGKAGVPDFNSYSDASPKSLWGELFYLLGEATAPNGGGAKALATLGAADHPEASPNAKQIEAVLPAGPILFLIDELVIYMAKLSERGQGNLLGFLNLLSAVVSNRPQTVLVVTDPGQQAVYSRQSQRIAAELAACAKNLEEIFGRKMTSIDPIGDESAKVIVRRLFGSVDQAAAQSTAQIYSDLYVRVAAADSRLLPTGGATPPTSPGYKKLIADCYPFHPRLLKTAEERLGAMDSFQKSRGVLRLFARIIRDVWNQKADCDLISAGEVNWSDKDIKSDLLERLQRDRFTSSIKADIEGHALDIDGGKRGVHTRAASALLLESLDTANSSSGFDAPELTLAILRPDEAGPEAGEALDRLIGVCWHTYPRPGGSGVQFRYEPNITRQIDEMRNKIDTDDAASRVRSEVQQYFGGSVFKLAAWPAHASQVPESADLQLALCASEKTATVVVSYSDDRDPSAPIPRGFKNALLAIAPSAVKWAAAVEKAQRLLAAEAIKKEHGTGSAGKQVLEQIERIEPDLRKQFFLHSYRAFDQVVLAGRGTLQLEEQFMVPEAQVMQRPNGQAGLRRFLEEKKLLHKSTDAIDADLFVTKVLPGATPMPGQPDAFTAKAVHERILSAPGLRLIPDADVVRSTILKAVEVGKVVVRFSDDRAFDDKGSVEGVPGHRRRSANKLSSTFALDDAVLVALSGSASAVAWVAEDKPDTKGGGGTPPPGGGGGLPPPPPPPPSQVTGTSWTAILNYAKVRPLLTLELRAPTPAVAATLATLAQPLGADSLTVTVTINGDAKDGGSVNFSAERLKLNHPTKPLQMAQTLFNSLSDGCHYEATVTLEFKGGRAGLHASLENLQQSASADVKPTGVFDKPTA
ncbi:hypothetical protein IMCC26134_10435 [Verrucomicrobia bacterium IMCC26134]|nr:hypothetical protein IMCC26134_10435 [Verrucomicrobia bacterium IMCC26134]